MLIQHAIYTPVNMMQVRIPGESEARMVSSKDLYEELVALLLEARNMADAIARLDIPNGTVAQHDLCAHGLMMDANGDAGQKFQSWLDTRAIEFPG